MLAFVLGMPMPAGLAVLDRRSAGLVPWAWGVNGVASVLGTGLALVVAMSAGYRWAVLLAVGVYFLAAAAGRWLRMSAGATCASEATVGPSQAGG